MKNLITKDQLCKICVNDGTSHGININSEGICNYCEEYDKLDPNLSDYITLEKLWLERLEKYKKSGEYDALLGISGGKDSTYVLYQLVNNYNLKIKTCTFDNGFLNNYAKEKINTIVDEFGVEHEYIKFRKEELAPLYNIAIRISGAICMSCEYIVGCGLVKKATNDHIPMAVLGSSRPQIFHAYSNKKDTLKKSLLKTALTPINKIDLSKTYKDIYKKFFNNIYNDSLNQFFPDYYNQNLAEFVPYFLYHPYNEKKIVSFLEKNTKWRRHPDYEVFTHFDCLVKQANYYLLSIARRRQMFMTELSVSIREGIVDRKEALRRLEKEISSPFPIESLQLLSDYIGKSVKYLISNAKKLDRKNIKIFM